MQVLDIDIRGSDSVYLHATDYTTNSLLSVRDQFRHLQHGVLKIILRDSQAEIAKLLKPGDVCTFQKVIVKLVNKENVGDLGGDQLLVKRLNPSLSNEKILMQGLEEYVVAYIRASQTCLTIFYSRKKNFYDTAKPLVSSTARKNAPALQLSASAPKKPKSISKISPADTKIYTSIDELESTSEPRVEFRIRGHITQAFPDKLEQFVRPHCTNCNKE